MHSTLQYQFNDMQLVHQHSKPKRLPSTDKASLQLQLKNAQNQIKILRQQNKLMANRIAHLQKQRQLFCFKEEELKFRKEEQDSMATLISNYQDINFKLQEQIKTLQQEIQITHKETTATIDTVKHNESFEGQAPTTCYFRTSYTRRGNRSDSFEKQKQNHPITPKSRVNIDLTNIFEDKMPMKKKVFV